MNVLGISAYYHDSASCLLADGQLIAAALEERFTRIKHDASFPVHAVKYCLSEKNMTIKDIDCIAWYEQPTDKLARQLDTGLSHRQMNTATLARLNPNRPEQDIRERLGFNGLIEYFPHHLSHAASSFFYSGFSEAALLVVDGVGEWACTSYGRGTGNQLLLEHQVDFPHSLGLFYSAMTRYLGFKVNDGEYKVMGLAPYGKPRYVDKIRQMIDIDQQGNLKLNMLYFDFSSQSQMLSPALTEHLGRPGREAESELSPFYCDVAASVQQVFEDIMLAKTRFLQRETQLDALCMAGGAALNCVANGLIRRDKAFKTLFVPPGAGDEGGAIGAATLAYHKHDARSKKPTGSVQKIQTKTLTHAYWGPAYSDNTVINLLNTIGMPHQSFTSPDQWLQRLASKLAEGAIVGWFHGRMEFGARALGSRSILADPRQADMRHRVNALVKKREGFRPFAPVVLADKAQQHFDLSTDSPFMVETCQVISPLSLPAITHEDGSARVQTIDKATNPVLASLLHAFDQLTACPMLLNTSFNMRGEPIVCTPTDAIACFIRSGLDILVLGNTLIERKNLSEDYVEGVETFYQLVDIAQHIQINHDAYTLI